MTSGRQTATREADLTTSELAGRLRLALGALVRRLRQRDPGHLAPAQLSALASVDVHGPLRIGELAARERVAPPTMTRVVAQLAEAGLVTRSTDPADGRVALVSLSPAGAGALDEVRRERTSQLVRRLAALPAEQRAALAAALPALEALAQD